MRHSFNPSRRARGCLVVGVIAVLAFIGIVWGGSTWWEHSTLTAFQEYLPSRSIAGATATNPQLQVIGHRYHNGGGSSKYLQFSLGTNGTLIEQDNSVYAPYTLNCYGQAQSSCHLIQTASGQTVRVVLTKPAVNLPPNQVTAEAVISKTKLSLTLTTSYIPSDSDLSQFFNSMQPVRLQHIPVMVK